MLHSGIVNYVKQDLEQISADFSGYYTIGLADMPDKLFYFTDSDGVRNLLEDNSLKVVRAKICIAASDISYGIDLVKSFLDARVVAEMEPIRKDFCWDCIADLNMGATWFEKFIIRFFASGYRASTANDSSSIYGFALLTEDMKLDGNVFDGKLQFGKVIYSCEAQLALLASIYFAYEECYVNAIQLFGEENQEIIFAACWDRFRWSAGELLIHFRDPSLATEEEWVASMRTLEVERGNDDAKSELSDNAQVCHVSVPCSSNSRPVRFICH